METCNLEKDIDSIIQETEELIGKSNEQCEEYNKTNDKKRFCIMIKELLDYISKLSSRYSYHIYKNLNKHPNAKELYHCKLNLVYTVFNILMSNFGLQILNDSPNLRSTTIGRAHYLLYELINVLSFLKDIKIYNKLIELLNKYINNISIL